MQEQILDFIFKNGNVSFLQIKAKFVKKQHAYFETKEDKDLVRSIDKALFNLIDENKICFIAGRYYLKKEVENVRK